MSFWVGMPLPIQSTKLFVDSALHNANSLLVRRVKKQNLIANPLVNKVHKGTLTLNDGNADLVFEDAVDDGWIAPTIYGWFENSYSAIDRIIP